MVENVSTKVCICLQGTSVNPMTKDSISTANCRNTESTTLVRGLIPCTGCNKKFTSNRYMKEHAKCYIDPDKKYACTYCRRQCSSPANLGAHIKRAHGAGYMAPCGKHFDWPPKYHRHLNSGRYDGCQQHKIEEKHKKYDIMAKAKHYFHHSM